MIRIIKAKDEFELVKEINSSNLDIFATQPMEKLDGSWVAFIYYNPSAKSDTPQSKQLLQKKDLISNSGVFIPTTEQLERWKKIRPTKKTIELLKKKDYTEDELKYIKTQYDAHTILESLNEDNL